MLRCVMEVHFHFKLQLSSQRSQGRNIISFSLNIEKLSQLKFLWRLFTPMEVRFTKANETLTCPSALPDSFQHLCYPLSSPFASCLIVLCFFVFFHQPHPHLFQFHWTSQRGYRFLTCLHLPPELAGPLAFEEGRLPFSHSPRVSSRFLFSRPPTPGHGNIGKNVRSDWQDKECRDISPVQADLGGPL